MNIPKTFVPDKESDSYLEEYLKTGKPPKIKCIACIDSLVNIPKKISNYILTKEFEKIPRWNWCYHFKKHMPKYLDYAGVMYYKIPKSALWTSVFVLEFENETNLNGLIKKTNVTKEFSVSYESCDVRCLKKDEYMVALHANKMEGESLYLIGDWYVHNFGMKELNKK